MKKVLWGRLVLQVLYLVSIPVYMYATEAFGQILNGMNIELPALAAFMFYPPGLYLYSTVTICAFVLFLWSWKIGRLENKIIRVMYNLPFLLHLVFIFSLLQ
jgi:hypothetical protein